MAATFHKTAFAPCFLQIVLFLFVTASSAYADHFHTDKYKEKNQILFDQSWARALEKLENQRDKNEGILFYSGFAMWGDERWSLGDAEKIGTAFEQFYDGSQHVKFIFSNEEENNLPKNYPTVMDNILREHFARLSVEATGSYRISSSIILKRRQMQNDSETSERIQRLHACWEAKEVYASPKKSQRIVNYLCMLLRIIY